MEGLGLVDYGSDLDDDARSPGNSEPSAPSRSADAADAAAAVHELEHLDSAAAAGTASVPQLTANAADIPHGLIPSISASVGDPGNNQVEIDAIRFNLQVATPGRIAAPLQEAVDKYLKMRRDLGVEVKAVIGLSRDFRNPYFLQKWVQDANIDQGGSCMPPESFDPSSLHEEDFYCNLERASRKKVASNSATSSGPSSKPVASSSKKHIQNAIHTAKPKLHQSDVMKRQQLGNRWLSGSK